MPNDRASALVSLMSTPSPRRRPRVARSNPARIIRNVVLPEPDGPSSVRNSPRAMSSDTSFSAGKAPNDLLTPIAWRPTARVLTPFALRFEHEHVIETPSSGQPKNHYRIAQL